MPLQAALVPARFAHPQANREARLPGASVAYLLKRTHRRSIGLVVGVDGLVVSAPRWVTLAQVDAVVQEKAAWLVRKLTAAQEREQRHEQARIEWRDGAELPYMGEWVRVVLQPGHVAAGHLHRLSEPEAAEEGVRALLQLGLPGHASPAQLRDAVQAWLMREARAVFVSRLDHFAEQLGVRWSRLTLSNAGTRWGSARVDGAIRLNWRLIHCSPSLIDYVVAHELAHLREMNHSPRFWETVAQVVPDYARRRAELHAATVPRWD